MEIYIFGKFFTFHFNNIFFFLNIVKWLSICIFTLSMFIYILTLFYALNMSNNIQFRDLDIQNKEKPWWVDCLKTGNIHSCNNEDVDFYLKNDSFYTFYFLL